MKKDCFKMIILLFCTRYIFHNYSIKANLGFRMNSLFEQ